MRPMNRKTPSAPSLYSKALDPAGHIGPQDIDFSGVCHQFPIKGTKMVGKAGTGIRIKTGSATVTIMTVHP